MKNRPPKMRLVLSDRYEYLRTFAATLPYGTFDSEGVVIHDQRNKIKLFEPSTGGRFTVKRFRTPNLLNKIVYTFFRGSKAKRAFRNGRKLLEKGYMTPSPIGYIEMKKRGLVAETFYMSGFTPLPSIESTEYDDYVTRGELIEALMKFAARMHADGIIHKDFNISNILFDESGGRFEFMMIDINRMRFGRIGRCAVRKSLVRFCSSAHSEPWVIEQVADGYAAARGWDRKKYYLKLSAALKRFTSRREFRRSFKR